MGDAATITDTDQNLSQRLHQALSASRDELFGLLQGQPLELLLAVMRNPVFDEHHLLALLKQRILPQEIFTTLQAKKHLTESNQVRFALLVHPAIPAHIAATLLPQLTIFELLKICLLPGIAPDQRLAGRTGSSSSVCRPSPWETR